MWCSGGRFGRLDDGGAFAWATKLNEEGAIAVPTGRADELISLLLEMPHLPRLLLPPELRFAEVAVPPHPRLTIKASKQHYDSSMLLAELSFEYTDQIVPATPTGAGSISPVRDDTCCAIPSRSRPPPGS